MTREEMKKMQARAPVRRFVVDRDGLVARAAEVGRRLKARFPGLDVRVAWWRELAPLTREERERARREV